ncbi:MAG: hypothetical protein NTY39_09750 [Campylobacterales bacterium]|nr:hypothetical protein [Campylobacterales bacterium]
MFFSYLSRLSSFEFQKKNEKSEIIPKNYPKKLEKAVLSANGELLNDFTLFHRDTALLLDILVFLPHYGLYLGEKILWRAQELQKAHIERSSRCNKKASTTRLESTERLIQRKLEDVLSFNFTPIERFFWMENLTEKEFDHLDTSFQQLLPKNRLIFKDEDPKAIRTKLHAVGTYHETPYSKLKTLGSLNAHTLLLPTHSEPFGTFISPEQEIFLNTPLNSSIITLTGQYGSGKSTALIRKVIQMLLEEPHRTIMVITPTLLHSEILRKELIAIMEFSAITLNLPSLNFSPLTLLTEPIEMTPLFQNSSIIVCDDAHLFKKNVLTTLFAHKGDRTFLVSSTDPLGKKNTVTLQNCYRSPHKKNIQCSQKQETLTTLLSELKELREHSPESSILILFTDAFLIPTYQAAINEQLNFESQLLNASFSLQYKNFNSITLSTPQFINSLEVHHTYLLNLNPDNPLYSLALSRASESVTIISDVIHPQIGEK